ncbi:dihydrolipoamide acetyltransferase family protein [Defluviimonas salinarum]|uniref:Dihydrolipoamide acetyltransferase component of pyruvate dehydrogenase complex n=1 Tax=Defluviimonas salinarum TaxID=2992147 RepID=A0ABT3J6E5_9RHOB|nr:dihydrolipoamide acetyltransferase family protein [Defluviimonas salinarum]MCW3783257.1 2-oxo acid dehydrogenase subunit E2 [Defluviimonas salinarum]
MTTFRLPDLGEGLMEAEIVAWQVSVGDHVTTDQPLLTVETDKAVVEIPAPYAGTVRALLADPGEVVATGAPLVEIDTGKGADTGAIVGDFAAPEPARPTAPVRVAHKAPARVAAAPAVRRLAEEQGVDLAALKGSGPGGAITSADVRAATSGLSGGAELRGVRRAMARAMAAAHRCVVPATVTDRADIHGWPPGEPPTPRLVHAIVAACRAEPALNAWFDGTRRQLHDHVDLAVAVDTPDGLFAPVLRGAEAAENVAAEVASLRRAVEARTLAPEDLRGGTITLSNFGMIAGEHAALVVTPPQVAIVGAGRIAEAVVAVGGAPAVRRLLPLSLTFDHRAVTGGEAARFLAALRADLERPAISGKEAGDG